MPIFKVEKCADCPFYICDLGDNEKDICKAMGATKTPKQWDTETIPTWCPGIEDTLAITPKLKSKKKYSHFEDVNGRKYSYAYLDGYSFAERLLESVMFKYEIGKDGYLRVSCCKGESADYFENFNKSEWLCKAMEYAEETDLFDSDEHNSTNELILIDENGN